MEKLAALSDLPPISYLIPMTLIVLGFLVICWAIYWEYRKKELDYHERRLMIEKGMTPPPQPVGQQNPFVVAQQLKHEERRLMLEKGIAPPSMPWTPRKYLLTGLLLTFLGMGLGIAYFLLNRTGDSSDAAIAGSWGGALGMIGIGCVIYYLMSKDGKE